MIVVGGVYSEYCYQPDWNQIYGSGGRGAAALTRLGVENVKLFTCLPEKSKKAAQATLGPYGIEIEARPSVALYEFAYLHPLSEPTLAPSPELVGAGAAISGDVVLAYGMLEGLPAISAILAAVAEVASKTNICEPLILTAVQIATDTRRASRGIGTVEEAADDEATLVIQESSVTLAR
jgi:hypothetical protein